MHVVMVMLYKWKLITDLISELIINNKKGGRSLPPFFKAEFKCFY